MFIPICLLEEIMLSLCLFIRMDWMGLSSFEKEERVVMKSIVLSSKHRLIIVLNFTVAINTHFHFACKDLILADVSLLY